MCIANIYSWIDLTYINHIHLGMSKLDWFFDIPRFASLDAKVKTRFLRLHRPDGPDADEQVLIYVDIEYIGCLL